MRNTGMRNRTVDAGRHVTSTAMLNVNIMWSWSEFLWLWNVICLCVRVCVWGCSIKPCSASSDHNASGLWAKVSYPSMYCTNCCSFCFPSSLCRCAEFEARVCCIRGIKNKTKTTRLPWRSTSFRGFNSGFGKGLLSSAPWEQTQPEV